MCCIVESLSCEFGEAQPHNATRLHRPTTSRSYVVYLSIPSTGFPQKQLYPKV